MAESWKSALELRRRITRRARKVHLKLPETVAAAAADYLALLHTWNQKINLTSLTDPDEAVDRLVIEPLCAARWLPPPPILLMDVGSGGGSPAIPLKLSSPALRLWMVESKTRKAAFLREAIRQLDLSSTEVESRRFEELLARPDLYEALDIVSIRAVRIDARTLFRVQSFLRPGGQVWLFTSGAPSGGWALPPMLALEAENPLLESRGSLLRRLRKRPQ